MTSVTQKRPEISELVLLLLPAVRVALHHFFSDCIPAALACSGGDWPRVHNITFVAESARLDITVAEDVPDECSHDSPQDGQGEHKGEQSPHASLALLLPLAGPLLFFSLSPSLLLSFTQHFHISLFQTFPLFPFLIFTSPSLPCYLSQIVLHCSLSLFLTVVNLSVSLTPPPFPPSLSFSLSLTRSL